MQTLKVNTKRMPSGKWSCFTTHKGMDKAFVGGVEVVSQMADWLKNESVEIVWTEPVIYPPKEKVSIYKFRKPVIDVGMV